MEAEGRAVLWGASVAEDTVRIRRTAEMHYTGQGHDVEVEMPAGPLAAACLGAITERFEHAYRALYRRVPLGVPIEALNFRVVVSGPLPDISVSGAKPGAASPTVATPVPKATRQARPSPDRLSSRSASPPRWPARAPACAWTTASP